MISACLAGLRTRYDGTDRLREGLLGDLAGRHIVPVCPEQLGGLCTPRPPQDIVAAGPGAAGPGSGEAVLDGAARVVTRDGADVTAAFVRGAEEVVRLARRLGAAEAYLAAGSPSCAAGSYPQGSGGSNGVAAAALLRAGVRVVDVE